MRTLNQFRQGGASQNGYEVVMPLECLYGKLLLVDLRLRGPSPIVYHIATRVERDDKGPATGRQAFEVVAQASLSISI